MQSPNESIAIALECARGHVHMLEELQAPMSDTEAWSRIILQSLEFHREQRTYWRNLVHSLPAHLKVRSRTRSLVLIYEVISWSPPILCVGVGGFTNEQVDYCFWTIQTGLAVPLKRNSN